MPQIDHHADNVSGLESPASDALEITPSDDTDLPVRPRAVLVGTAGTLRVQMDNAAVTITCAEGSLLPIRPTRIYSTGTTAGQLVILW